MARRLPFTAGCLFNFRKLTWQGERHLFHRRVIGSFLTPSHLETFAATVQTETSTMLSKWDRAAAAGTPVRFES